MRNLWMLLSAATLAVTGCADPGLQHRAFVLVAANTKEVQAADVLGADAGEKPSSPAPDAAPRLPSAMARQIVYDGRLTLVVGDVALAMERTRVLTEELGGYLQKMSGEILVIRVPAEAFRQALERLEALGTIVKRDISAQDVTEALLDLEVRLNNAKAMSERLRQLLAKAQDVKAALEVEKELTRVLTEIERLEGQLNALSTQVAFATLSVTFQRIRDLPPTPTLDVKLPFLWLHDLGMDNLLNL